MNILNRFPLKFYITMGLFAENSYKYIYKKIIKNSAIKERFILFFEYTEIDIFIIEKNFHMVSPKFLSKIQNLEHKKIL